MVIVLKVNNKKREKIHTKKHKKTINYTRTTHNKLYSVQMARITVAISSCVNIHCCMFSLNINVPFNSSTSACNSEETLHK